LSENPLISPIHRLNLASPSLREWENDEEKKQKTKTKQRPRNNSRLRPFQRFFATGLCAFVSCGVSYAVKIAVIQRTRDFKKKKKKGISKEQKQENKKRIQVCPTPRMMKKHKRATTIVD
jgi:hypothetical protein